MKATCVFCKQKMEEGNGCTIAKETMGDGRILDRLPYRGETGPFCGDCNAGVGQFHHSGCDLERCASCNLQALGCDCYLTEEEKILVQQEVELMMKERK